MIIVGAKGFAKELLEVLHQLNQLEHLVFYDDVNEDVPAFLYEQFSVLRNKEDAAHYFKTIDSRFTIGIGNPVLRKKLAVEFKAIGGDFISTISPLAKIGNYGNSIGEGSNIMTGTVITNDVTIGEGVLINLNCTVGHDSKIGGFVELSPGVHISGNCTIGNYCKVGSNATILPKINIGENVIVGAGSVVTKDIPDNCLVVGVPAIIKKELPKLIF
jgi:sugar O-acyltransferase (sialic acid O-acetyltransferase NeuD family)